MTVRGVLCTIHTNLTTGIARPRLSPPLMVNLAVTLGDRPKDLKDPLIRTLPEPLLFPCGSTLELYDDWWHCHLFRLNSMFCSIKNHTSCLLLERYSRFLTLLWFRQKYKSLKTIYFKFYLAYIFRYAVCCDKHFCFCLTLNCMWSTDTHGFLDYMRLILVM